jgi:hypothetical protein
MEMILRSRIMVLIMLIYFNPVLRSRIIVLIALICFILAMLLGGGAPAEFTDD